ncbi:hypothetical protein LO762_05245 [Actinocorallia sp. API 0066]|uniref:type III-B CRISPR module-associated Cmr3 family protein n=1 Tax=Actinocorallia sp. API 0066 TaxID=2896846 RepID=UPI001E576384|nr:type III-B CRISPR module-associated Cmr3 family protein [Actinocorallia sp. API 0066]MCD0448602.1 hypothetical protein [Actinocorallia sp. API 0066]
MNENWLAFTPRDTVLVRDGRAFDAGTDASSESVRPWPSTVAGAVRTAYGRDPDTVRGPVLALRLPGGWRPYFPMPADVVRSPTRSRCFLLRPDPGLGGVHTDLGDGVGGLLAPPQGVEDAEPLDGWIDSSSLAVHLAGGFPAHGFGIGRKSSELTRYKAPDGPQPFQPLVDEPRVGLARTASRSAREGYLYRAVHLRPREGWAFLACCEVPEPWTAQGPAPLGGRARVADVEDVTGQSGVAWPQGPTTFPDGKVLLYLATPALWPDGWRPPLPDGVALEGAAVPAALPVASASPRQARHGRTRLLDTVSLRWAVPAGAVYLLRFPDQDSAGRWAAAQHGRALAPARAPRMDTAGFGVVLTGRW